MKKYLFFLTLLLSAGLFSGGCKKFLGVQPRDKVFESEAFSTKEGVYSALNGIYTELAIGSLYGENLNLGAADLMAQYYPSRGASIYVSSGALLTTFNYIYPGVLDIFRSVWADAYTTNLNINNFYTNATRLGSDIVSDKERRFLLGEALGLRAMVHFDLLRLFGPVYLTHPDSLAIPYVTQAAYDVQPFLTARQALDSITSDLTMAAQLLQDDPVIVDGGMKAIVNNDFWALRNRRMNYFAVSTLLSRVYLYGGNNAQANSMAGQTLAKMNNSFPWMVSAAAAAVDPVFSRETLFGVENRDLYNLQRSLFNSALIDDSILAPAPSKLNAVYSNANDFRLQSWFKAGVEGNKAYKVFVKYNDPGSAGGNRYFQPLIKKSELYLILAETETDPSKAYDYLNTLRQNRGINALPVMQSTGQRLTSIQEEYAREFWGEGQLFFFYKRRDLTAIPDVNGTGTVVMYDGRYVPAVPQDEYKYR